MADAASRGKGKLSVVATPIGNLEDITLRALRVLREADVIAAEDTRHTKILLDKHGIDRPLTSLHEHNEDDRASTLLDRIAAGQKVALVSDAGTPTVNDPGFRFVRAARERDLEVEIVPGPSAVMVAVAGAGLPAETFAFLGFPPRKGGELARWSKETLSLPLSIVFFESPRRLVDTLTQLAELDPSRQACVCRELTKRHEEFARGPLEALAAQMAEREEILGEVTVLLAPPDAPLVEEAPFDFDAEVSRLEGEGKSKKEIAKVIAKIMKRKASDVYADLVDPRRRR